MTAGKRILRCTFWVQVQVSIFMRLEDIEEEWERMMPEKKWNYAKRAPQCLHMSHKDMLHRMKAIIDAKGGVTKYKNPIHKNIQVSLKEI